MFVTPVTTTNTVPPDHPVSGSSPVIPLHRTLRRPVSPPSRKLASLAGGGAWVMPSSRAVHEALSIVEVIREGLVRPLTVAEQVSAGR